jgi:hypothetical protein
MGLVDGQAAEPDVRYDLGPRRSTPSSFVGPSQRDPEPLHHPALHPPAPLPEGTGSHHSNIPAIPSFTHIAKVAPFQNPVRDASELLGEVKDKKTVQHGRSANTKGQHSRDELKLQSEPAKEAKKPKRGSMTDDSASGKKQRTHSQSQAGRHHFEPFGEDENSLAGHALGGFEASPLRGGEGLGQGFSGLFHDADSLLGMGGGGRGLHAGPLMMDELSHLSMESWGGGAADGAWTEEFSLGAHATDRRGHDDSHTHSQASSTEDVVSSSPAGLLGSRSGKSMGGGRAKQGPRKGRGAGRKSSTKIIAASSQQQQQQRVHVPPALLGASNKEAFESNPVELVNPEHSFLPGVSDEFSMM